MAMLFAFSMDSLENSGLLLRRPEVARFLVWGVGGSLAELLLFPLLFSLTGGMINQVKLQVKEKRIFQLNTTVS
jgi:hypothetical protein